MRVTSLIVLVLIALCGCGKNDSEPVPVFTSPDGMWIYTTPDKKIEVEFELKTTKTGTLQIQNTVIRVDGVQGAAAGMLTNVDLPFIEQIRINANDATLISPYFIQFTDCSISSTFNYISVSSAMYSYPYGTNHTLTGVVINRK